MSATVQTAFALKALLAERETSSKTYLEFLRIPSMSMGLYVLDVVATDPQNPHREDEVYVVTSGKAKIRVGSDVHNVQAGSIVYVDAQVEHKFFEIEERLETLVFFAPAEYAPTKK
jgi:mannose-6-phosphate isomerase-like protein (cupin superfamily)